MKPDLGIKEDLALRRGVLNMPAQARSRFNARQWRRIAGRLRSDGKASQPVAEYYDDIGREAIAEHLAEYGEVP